MAAHVENVIDPAHEPEIAVLILLGTVPGEVQARKHLEVGLPEPLRVAVHPPHHAGPRLIDDEHAPLVHAGLASVFTQDAGPHTEVGQGRAPRLQGEGRRKGSDQDAARLGLPPCVDHRATTVSHDRVVPYPGLRVDRLAHRPEQPDARPVVFLHPGLPLAGKGANGRGGRVEDRHLVLVHHLPPAARIRVGRDPLEHEGRGPVGQRPVDDVGMARDPSDIGAAPEDVLIVVVKDVLEGVRRVDHVPARGVQHPLGLSG